MKCPHPVTRSSKEAYDPNKVFRHTCAVTGLAPRSPDSVQWTCPVQFHAIRHPTQPRPAANRRASESLGFQPWRPIPANGTEHCWMQWTCPSYTQDGTAMQRVCWWLTSDRQMPSLSFWCSLKWAGGYLLLLQLSCWALRYSDRVIWARIKADRPSWRCLWFNYQGDELRHLI